MFAKIFETIFDSSIADDWKVRIVFQDMLVLADKEGIVDRTPEAIARRTNLPLDIVRESIPKLESPDPASRTPDFDGRRIVRLDQHREWGWRIVNFTKYRESATKEMLRMAEADRKRAYRARFHGKKVSPRTPFQRPDAEAEGEAEQSMDTSRTCPGQVEDCDDSPPIDFMPIKPGLYRREYEAMIADAQKAIQKIKADPKNYVKDLTTAAEELIGFLTTEKPENWRARVEEVYSNAGSYERKNPKPKTAAILKAWTERVTEIRNAMNGIKQP
jgi:hypothetical protein